MAEQGAARTEHDATWASQRPTREQREATWAMQRPTWEQHELVRESPSAVCTTQRGPCAGQEASCVSQMPLCPVQIASGNSPESSCYVQESSCHVPKAACDSLEGSRCSQRSPGRSRTTSGESGSSFRALRRARIDAAGALYPSSNPAISFGKGTATSNASTTAPPTYATLAAWRACLPSARITGPP